MERNTPVRKPHTSTADLLTWSDTPPSEPPVPESASSCSNDRPNKPSGVGKVVFGGQITEEEAESLNKRKPCSGYKLKEITGSGIFVGNAEDDAAQPGSANGGSNNKTVANVPANAFGNQPHHLERKRAYLRRNLLLSPRWLNSGN